MKTLTFLQKRHQLWVQCLAFSLLLHVAALTFFYFNPLVFQGNLKSLFGISPAAPSSLQADAREWWQKNRHLEETFQKIITLSPHFQQPYDLVELPQGIALAPNSETAAFQVASQLEKIEDNFSHEIALTYPAKFQEKEDRFIPDLFIKGDAEHLIASQLQIDTTSAIPEIPLSAIPPISLKDYEDLVSMSGFALHPNFEADYALNLSLERLSPNSLKIGNDLQLKAETKTLAAVAKIQDLRAENEPARSTLFIPKGSTSTLEKRAVNIAKSFEELERYDFPSTAMAAEWNDDFDATVTFLPNPEGKGYIFSIALNPNYDLSAHSLKQNLYFILDRSSTVQKHRFNVFKRAILKALTSMQQGDTFNIFVVDKKITRFNQENNLATLKNIRAAEEFLDRQEGGALFCSSEVYPSLEKILASIPDNDEIHTGILLTDGKTNLNATRRQSQIKKWIEKNSGKMSLYTAAIGRDNDLLALDLLSSVSGGKLLYSDTHAAFPRKLAKLILDLRDPIATDLTISAVPYQPQSHFEFYPACSHLPALYSHQPYVVVGQVDDPCAFDLIIQGRHRDQWIAIKKNISFNEGQKGDHQLTSEWNAQHAHLCYAKFLKEGKPTHLKEAKEILKKSRAEIAFE